MVSKPLFSPFSIPGGFVLCMVVAFLFWIIRLVQVIYDIWKAWELHQFFKQVLCIGDVSFSKIFLMLRRLFWYVMENLNNKAE